MMHVHSRTAAESIFLMHKEISFPIGCMVANTMGFYFVTFNITKGHREWKDRLHTILGLMKNKKGY